MSEPAEFLNSVVTHPMLSMIEETLSPIAPEEWLILSPWVEVLLWAQDRGDSYIEIPYSQIDILSQLTCLLGKPNSFMPFILDQNRLFSGRIWQLEQDIAVGLYSLAQTPVAEVNLAVKEDLENWFPEKDSQEQRFAATLALYQSFVLINGGPGTGKTTTVAKILALIIKHVWQASQQPRIVLAAPTGKAAAHMAQALHKALGSFQLEQSIEQILMGVQGQTVHRLLQLRPPLMESFYNQERPLPVDILVIDEASMLDLSLFRLLLRAIKQGTRLILLGDANQLPAVGAGNVLGDLSQSTQLTPELIENLSVLLDDYSLPSGNAQANIAAHVATLVHSYRFRADQGIGALAEACIQSDADKAQAVMTQFPKQLQWAGNDLMGLGRQLYLQQTTWWQAVSKNDIEAVFAHITDLMVLTAHKADAQAFNEYYRTYLQKQGHTTLEPWFAGMPILITQNDYNVNLFNGDIGIILSDQNEPQRLVAYFREGQTYRTVSLSRLPEHELAFAITVHKSQGSEYDTVWLIAPQSSPDDTEPLFNQALFYTALTRARKQFVFCGHATQLTHAIKQRDRRRSGLTRALNRLYTYKSL